MYYWIGEEKVLTSITKLKWRYVEDYDFYDVVIEIDGFTEKRIYLNRHRLPDLNMPIPETIAFLLRASLDCDPVRGVEKSVDKRGSA